MTCVGQPSRTSKSAGMMEMTLWKAKEKPEDYPCSGCVSSKILSKINPPNSTRGKDMEIVRVDHQQSVEVCWDLPLRQQCPCPAGRCQLMTKLILIT